MPRRRNSGPGDIISEECIAVRLRMVARVVNRIYNQALREWGLTISQLNILAAVARMREARQQDISDLLLIEKSTFYRRRRPAC